MAYVGSRHTAIEAMLASFRSRNPDGGRDAAAPAARADRPEAEPVQPVAAEQVVPATGGSSDDADRVERERQSRLRRWQTPALHRSVQVPHTEGQTPQ